MTTDPFDQWNLGDVKRLVDENPLGWMIAVGDPAMATPMPLLLETDADCRPVSLLGHLPRRHPLVEQFRSDPRGVFLFQGPHGYITPEWLADKDWAPTWNFAIARFWGDLAFDEAITDLALTRLVDHMEAGRASPWDRSALGGRYAALKARVIGFKVSIQGFSARFKLGQDERPDVRDQILKGLGETPLAEYMRGFCDAPE